MSAPRVVVVDLLCNSPFFSGALTRALRDVGAAAELASPLFYLEPAALAAYPRARWITDLVVHVHRPRPVRLAVRAAEIGLNATRLVWSILRGRYDVVHVQWIPLELRTTAFMRLLSAVCRQSGTTLVVTAHNALPHDRPNADRARIRANLERADLVIALADHVAKTLSDQIGVRTPIARIPHGPMFADQQLPPRREAAARLGTGDGPTILFFGLVRAYKGVDILAAAWPAVHSALPTARLLVVGKVLDPAARTSLDELAPLTSVTIVDEYVSVERMLDCYAAADLVVFPYHRISQSAGVMTAAGLGRPIVITPVDGLVEQARSLTSVTVSDDVTGAAIAQAIIAATKNLDRQQAAAAHDRAALANSPTGWPAVARATLQAYNRVRAPRRRRS